MSTGNEYIESDIYWKEQNDRIEIAEVLAYETDGNNTGIPVSEITNQEFGILAPVSDNTNCVLFLHRILPTDFTKVQVSLFKLFTRNVTNHRRSPERAYVLSEDLKNQVNGTFRVRLTSANKFWYLKEQETQTIDTSIWTYYDNLHYRLYLSQGFTETGRAQYATTYDRNAGRTIGRITFGNLPIRYNLYDETPSTYTFTL